MMLNRSTGFYLYFCTVIGNNASQGAQWQELIAQQYSPRLTCELQIFPASVFQPFDRRLPFDQFNAAIARAAFGCIFCFDRLTHAKTRCT